ncbi:protein kinase domain-containing protein [Aeromicrobium duanguangcaii]|uniref:non-specific serine/threonine protein kinase n=1 Tax=Aeromicrobium duanguangcaii TaxID=2968086 RepID=A0ABY5KAR1_9ACTN|nr:protein kinase [Aeromicrobium duanguangcaii]MCD9152883.1 protein kinase [Aeromicrobium duanguangcaii]UUI67138.1 protein kinase [Aeromicrobium duanguangcaii]
MAVHKLRYTLDEVVGSGGMGAVYRATDTRLGRTVAVKVLRADQSTDEVARARLRSEAHLAASIQHPGVAQVFDFEEDDASADRSTYIVMQYVEGRSLAELLKERGPLPPDQVMSIVHQVAEGLQAAHDAGIVHRDLKPANIMLTPAGRTVLVDFGIAQATTSDPLTDTGALVGTTDYISPEQVRGQAASPQSDIYSLGLVAYHCLTGRSPFRRDTHVATAMAQLHDELPALDASVPARVERLIRTMTAKKAAHRPVTAADVAHEAMMLGAAESIDLPATFEISLPQPWQSTADVNTAPTPAPARETPRRGTPLPAYAAIAVVLALVVILGTRQLLSSDPVVPDVVGMSAQDAAEEIRAAGFIPRAEVVDVATRAEGDVVEQSPSAGSEEQEDAAIEISVASGKVPVSAASVIGTGYAEAAAALEEQGFVVRREEVTRSSDVGEVVAMDKSGRLPDGATITLSVAVAPVITATRSGGATRPPSAAGGPKDKPGNNGNKGKAKGKNRGNGP